MDHAKIINELVTISPALYGVMCALSFLCILLATGFLVFNIKLRHYRYVGVLQLNTLESYKTHIPTPRNFCAVNHPEFLLRPPSKIRISSIAFFSCNWYP